MRARLALILIAGLLVVGPACAAKRALLVAVSRYPGRRAIPGPPEMAQRLKMTLVDKAGFAEEDIMLLQDQAATHDALMEAVQHQLIDGVQPGDTVLFWFAGHGSRVPKEDATTDDDWEGVIMPFDGVENWIGNRELHELLSRVPTRNFTVLFDCCHSGLLTRGRGNPNLVPLYVPLPEASQKRAVKALPRPSGSVGAVKHPYMILTACREDQAAVAVRDPKLGNYLAFTRALLEALQTAAEPLTYRGWVDQARGLITKWGLIFPDETEPQDPQLQGPSPDAVVFGAG